MTGDNLTGSTSAGWMMISGKGSCDTARERESSRPSREDVCQAKDTRNLGDRKRAGTCFGVSEMIDRDLLNHDTYNL